MRVLLSLLLTLSLLTVLLPGVSAETYRYVATGLPVGCQDDPLTGTDGICPGPIEIPVDGYGWIVFDFSDDVMGSDVAHTVDFLSADEERLETSVRCGSSAAEIPFGTDKIVLTFHPLLVKDDLTACSATTGTVTV